MAPEQELAREIRIQELTDPGSATMPDIRPLRGLRYDETRVDLAEVVAPPYDTIGPTYQEELYARSPYNVVRLILGREADRYAAAASCLNAWRKAGILRPDPSPALYVLSQSFPGADGAVLERTGFIAACRLEEFSKGVILPHEKTLSKPKEDRFKLMQATGTNFSQILGLYSDSGYRIDRLLEPIKRTSPLLEATFEGIVNRLWRVEDAKAIKDVAAEVGQKSVLIADGHHRYETALAYRDMKKLRAPAFTGEEPFCFTMMFLTNMESEGLVILPTHRLVHSLPDFDPDAFLSRLTEAFEVRPAGSETELLHLLRAGGDFAYGVVLSGGLHLIRCNRREGVSSLLDGNVAPELRELDVTLLHTYVLGQLLGMSSRSQEEKLNLDYVKDPGEVFQAVRSGKAQVGFLMNPTQVEQVRRVARAGLTMPQKSTYFYPKLVSGLVMNVLE